MQPCALFKNTENKASTLLRETLEKTEQRQEQDRLESTITLDAWSW